MSNLASRRHWHETKSFWTILLTCEWPKFGWQNLKTAKCKSPNYFEEISCQNLICQARTSYNTKRSKLRKDSRKRGLCTSPHPTPEQKFQSTWPTWKADVGKTEALHVIFTMLILGLDLVMAPEDGPLPHTHTSGSFPPLSSSLSTFPLPCSPSREDVDLRDNSSRRISSLERLPRE